MPVAWVNALNAAVAAGKIPNIPMSNVTPGKNPVYPNGLIPTSSEICSGTYGCKVPGDIWSPPAGVFASAFDDGPTPVSCFNCLPDSTGLSHSYPNQSTPTLVNFLQSHNETTTHFMIGSNILYYPSQFLIAFNAGHDIALHTFTHPYLTTKNNTDIVGEVSVLSHQF
jgi:chitin deacetylase